MFKSETTTEKSEPKYGEAEEESDNESSYFQGEHVEDIETIKSDDVYFEETEWVDAGEYGEDEKFFLYVPRVVTEYHTVWDEDEKKVPSSEASAAVSEVEETEEEKEIKRERESLIEEVRRIIMDRMLLKRRNAFLQKKLVEHYKKRRMEHVLKEEPKALDLENKYLKRLYVFQELKQVQEKEISELTISKEQYDNKTKCLQHELAEKLDSFVTKAKEVSLSLISSKTGKKLNEKAVDRLLRRYINKSEEKGKKKLQYIKIKNLIEEKEGQLKVMEHFGEGLHIVDYEQMKIDNQNYNDKIEEREDELTNMRLKTQQIILTLAHIREKSYAIEGDIELMEEKVYDVEKKFTETREKLTKARKRRDQIREEFSKLKSVSGLLTRDELLRDFETSIYESKNLAKSVDRIKKVINEKKKQESELAKIFNSSSYGDMSYRPRQDMESKSSRKSIANRFLISMTST